jgi:hypothetical protein
VKEKRGASAGRLRPVAEVKVSFSGHETFVFRYGWLKKAVDAVLRKPNVFTSDDAMVVLGVGKNMVRSIRHWALATGIIEEQARSRGAELKISELGDFLFGPGGHDPYLEDINTLWLLHWNLATREDRSTVWCWAFNLLQSNEFTRQSLTAVVRDELRRHNLKGPSESSLGRDIDCFIRTYTATNLAKRAVLEDSLDCPLVELGIIEEDASPGLFRFKRGAQLTLADEVFAHALIDFWNRVAQTRKTLAFSEIAYGTASPGMVFRLDENSLSERLDRLGQVTHGRLVYTETAGLKQVYRHGHVPAAEFLKQYFRKIERAMPVGA